MQPLELDGLLDWADPHIVCSDRFSPIGVQPAGADVLGVHRLFLKGQAGDSALPLLEPAARLFVAVADGQWEPVPVRGRTCHPAGWIEDGQIELPGSGAWRVHQEVFFRSASRLAVRWRCVGPAGVPAPRLAVLLARARNQPLAGGSADAGGCTLQLALDLDNPFLKRRHQLDLRLRLEAIGGCHAASLHPDQQVATLAPEGGGRQAVGAGPAAAWIELGADATGIDLAWTFADAPEAALACASWPEARQRWDDLVAKLPPLTSSFARRRLAQSLATIMGASIRCPGYGAFSTEIGLGSAVTGWASTAFWWDVAFSSPVLGLVDPAWMASVLRCFLQHTAGGRMLPGILLAHPPYAESDNFVDCYAPIQCWAVAKAQACGGVAVPLAELYPLLVGGYEGWFRHCDRDGDGIPEWRNAGNPADDSPLYDAYSPNPGKVACFPLPPFISAQLVAFLMQEARLLGDFATTLGRAEDAARWRAEAARLDRILVERLWDRERQLFLDRDLAGQPVPIRTFFGLLPLWAGASLPRAEAEAAIRRHLLDPRGLGGAIPFPSVAKDEPTYDAAGYWRGRCWPHIYVWHLELLHQYGFHAEAEAARRTFLKLQAAWHAPAENWPSDPALVHRPGVLAYIWGAGAQSQVLLGWEQHPLATAGN